MLGYLFILGLMITKRPELPYIDINLDTKLPKGYDRGFRVLNIRDLKIYDITDKSVYESIRLNENKFIGYNHFYIDKNEDIKNVYKEIKESIAERIILTSNYTDNIVSDSEYVTLIDLPEEEKIVTVNINGKVLVLSYADASSLEGISVLGYYSYSKKVKWYIKHLYRTADKEEVQGIANKLIELDTSKSKLANILNVVADCDIDSLGRLLHTKSINGILHIPNGVIEIGNGSNPVVHYSDTVSELYIPKSVVKINNYAFHNKRIERVIFHPESNLEVIGDEAFSYKDTQCNCRPTKLVRLGKGSVLEGISRGLFKQNTNLKEINTGCNWRKFDTEAFYSGVKINPKSFVNCEFETVELYAYAELKHKSFERCEVKHLKIYGDLELNGSPFFNADIDRITIYATDKDINVSGPIFGGTTIGKLAIEGKHRVYFGDKVFYKSRILWDSFDASIANKIGKFGNYCFQLANIPTIAITKNMTLGKGIFSEAIIDYLEYDNDRVPDYAFYKAEFTTNNPNWITNLLYHNKGTLLYIGKFAFKHMLLGITKKDLIYRIDCKIIGEEAFSTVSWINDKLVINNCKQVGNRAFEECNSREIEINGRYELGDEVFRECNKLDKLDIKDCIAIGKGTISELPQLRDLVLGDKLQKIDRNNFNYCANLESITIKAESYYNTTAIKLQEKLLKTEFCAMSANNIYIEENVEKSI